MGHAVLGGLGTQAMRRGRSAGSSSTPNGLVIRPVLPAVSVVRVTYRPRLSVDTTIFGLSCNSTRQYTGTAASAYMAGLIARSIEIVDGETISTTARTASQGSRVVVSSAASAATMTTSGTRSLLAGRATLTLRAHPRRLLQQLPPGREHGAASRTPADEPPPAPGSRQALRLRRPRSGHGHRPPATLQHRRASRARCARPAQRSPTSPPCHASLTSAGPVRLERFPRRSWSLAIPARMLRLYQPGLTTGGVVERSAERRTYAQVVGTTEIWTVGHSGDNGSLYAALRVPEHHRRRIAGGEPGAAAFRVPP